MFAGPGNAAQFLGEDTIRNPKEKERQLTPFLAAAA
jgi:hypothetical protein